MTHLRTSAKSFARSALIHVTSDDDQIRGVVDAGTAVEQLAKATLASLAPALIAAPRATFDTMLHLSGRGDLAGCRPHEIQTVSAHEACIRCAKVVPGFVYSKTDQRLFDARNAGAHLAVTNSDLAREAAQIMVRLVESLIRYSEVDRQIFWGDMMAAADSLLDEKASRVSAAVEMKIAVARSRLETRLEGLGADNRQLVLKTLSGRPFYSEDEEPEGCPACGQTAVVYCELHDTGSPDFNYEQVDADEIYVIGYIDQIAHAIQLWCPACFLELDYEEMTAASLVTEYRREPRECDPGEFDWDDGRD